mgnify:CR=1 FL=1
MDKIAPPYPGMQQNMQQNQMMQPNPMNQGNQYMTPQQYPRKNDLKKNLNSQYSNTTYTMPLLLPQ